jgi:Sugar phosphate isomerases/epimerases
MQLGIRAHDMGNFPFEELIERIGQLGFKCVHLALYKAVIDIPTDNGALTPGLALYMRRIFKENNVDVAILGCYKNLANPDSVQLAEIIETYKAHIRFASLLGCGMVGTETGAVNTEYKFEPANFSEEALDIFIQNLKIVVDYAENMGVIFAIEPVASHIVNNNKRVREVLDRIASSNLQVIFDPVNIMSMENYERQDEVIKEAFELYGKEIIAVHAKDFKVIDGKIVSVAAGLGDLNYDLVLKYIKEYKPFMHVTLEDAKIERCSISKAYVEDKYASVCIEEK